MNLIEELVDSYNGKVKKSTRKSRERYEKAIVYYVEVFVEAGKNHFTYQRPSDNAWCVDPMGVRSTLNKLYVKGLAKDLEQRVMRLYEEKGFIPMLLF